MSYRFFGGAGDIEHGEGRRHLSITMDFQVGA